MTDESCQHHDHYRLEVSTPTGWCGIATFRYLSCWDEVVIAATQFWLWRPDANVRLRVVQHTVYTDVDRPDIVVWESTAPFETPTLEDEPMATRRTKQPEPDTPMPVPPAAPTGRLTARCRLCGEPWPKDRNCCGHCGYDQSECLWPDEADIVRTGYRAASERYRTTQFAHIVVDDPDDVRAASCS
jgi:hypothetical protein